MKKVISVATVLFCSLLTVHMKAQNFEGFKKELSGKKITSVIEHNSKASPLANAAQAPVNSGGMTITVNNAGQSFNSVKRTMSFSAGENGFFAERGFVRIKTFNKGSFGEMTVDTDNPFERPAALEKMGEGYDKLVKEKNVHKITTTGVNIESGSASFNEYWNQYLPFLSLDSGLNLVVFNVPDITALSKGKQWEDSVKSVYIHITNKYTVKSDDGDVLTIECKGTNVLIPDPALEKSNVVSLKVIRLLSNYTGTLLVDKKTGFVREANFEAFTTTRKNVMGQKIDAEKMESLKIVNKFD
jgi:hypothetical protein